MKKRVVCIIAGIVLMLIGIASFFARNYVDDSVLKLSLAVLTIICSGFLVYSNYEIESKAMRVYAYIASAILALLGIIPLLGFLMPYEISIKIHAFAYGIVLLSGSAFILMSKVK